MVLAIVTAKAIGIAAVLVMKIAIVTIAINTITNKNNNH